MFTAPFYISPNNQFSAAIKLKAIIITSAQAVVNSDNFNSVSIRNSLICFSTPA
ncbi:hypothetical protein AXX16_3080 [Serratia rubidaea]|nr:hypothetical protein AXX16_3080 [Serratia rubidaea]